jgi:hypothetical protein
MSEIKSKYPFLAMGNLLGGGFLIVAVFAWSAATVVWLGFAVSILLLAFGGAIAYSALRDGAGLSERIGVTTLGVITSLVASWTIIASLVFAPSTARWLIFASACAQVMLSMASLGIREVTAERVVHQLEVREREAMPA